jgi:hypothetical protein
VLMDPRLGTRGVTPICEPQYHPIPAETPAGERVAILVAHGMGQQVPYETIEDAAEAVWRGVQNAGVSAAALQARCLKDGKQLDPPCVPTAQKPVIRSVRLGTEDKPDVDAELVRAEITVTDEQGIARDVHIYEAYWAPLTEGKVTAREVISFLLNAGWDGIVNTHARTYHRWMFGKERNFKLATEGLTLAFAIVLLLLASLLTINSVLAAAAASHVIGASNPFPSGDLLPRLTWDIVIVDLAGIVIGLGIFAFGRSKWGWIRNLGWLLIGAGEVGICFAAVLIVGHLAGRCWVNCVTPVGRWKRWVEFHPLLVLLLWTLEIGAAAFVRKFLIEYVGDVAAYIAAHTVSQFWELRQKIWQTAMKVARVIYRAQTVNGDFYYPKVIVMAHSLGTVIGYDVLNGMLLEDSFACKPVRSPSESPLQVADRTRMFLTFGSPLDKTAFVFRTQQEMNSGVREVGATAVQPMIASYNNRPKEWVNLWSRADIISGHLDFYDPPTAENAKSTLDHLSASGRPRTKDPREVQNLLDPDARTPLKAHVEYWTGNLVAEKLFQAITT